MHLNPGVKHLKPGIMHFEPGVVHFEPGVMHFKPGVTCPPGQKSRVERLKAKVEPLLDKITVDNATHFKSYISSQVIPEATHFKQGFVYASFRIDFVRFRHFCIDMDLLFVYQYNW